MNETLKTRIDDFVAHVDRLVADSYKTMYKSLTPPTHRADYISDKWCRIVVVENGKNMSVYCFVCLQDGFTKTLGQLKAGDIHKAASWKVAAKHARGSVFSPDFDNCATVHGIVYLRN